jgi:hypothetical protein
VALKLSYEAICDYSRALLGALTRSFCDGLSIRKYIENCVLFLSNRTVQLPKCYIRIDVAHMMKIFCRIKCVVRQKRKHIKEYYVKYLRLLIKAKI